MSDSSIPPRREHQSSGGSGLVIAIILGSLALVIVAAAALVLGAFVLNAESRPVPVAYSAAGSAAVPTVAGSMAMPAGRAVPLPPVEAEAAGSDAADEAALAQAEESAARPKPKDEPQWTPLFNGKTLDGWKATNFGGEGDVTVKDGAVVMEMGNDMTGITLAKEPPHRTNYEIRLEAQRVDGSDFFCGLTFPVGDEYCSLILGGWGGGLCGLSSLNGLDASENETASYQEFKNGEWHDVRLRVIDNKIEAWLDKEQIVDQDIRERELGIRVEVDLSRPLGLATWRTTGAVRNLRMRPLTAVEVKAINATLRQD